MEALGVFDGHGGKGAGQYTAKHIMPAVTSCLKQGGSKAAAQLEPSGKLDLDGLQSDLAGGDVDAWQLQDAAVEQLPEALSHAFQQVQNDFFASSKVWTCTRAHSSHQCIHTRQSAAALYRPSAAANEASTG